ncbi:MAG: hypothetical protein QW063_02760 [Candidatus Nanoarchaeia archaeon]
MAADVFEKAKVEIIALAKNKKFTKARDKLDALLAKIKSEKDKLKILREIDKALKPKQSVTYILKGDAVATRALTHDAFGESIEPTYYWILDFLRENMGYNVSKSADFFAASEASGYYGEMGQRRTAMETRLAGGGQVPGIFGTINAVVKSILALIFDLKMFDLRLKHYDDAKSKNPEIKKTAINGLKGIWLNEVDKQKGNAAIDILTTQLGFITLRDAFMIVPVQDWYVPDAGPKKIEEIKDKADKCVKAMDLTDVVKRVLAPRIKEFIDWLYLSEKELRNRRAVEKAYLKAQVTSLKLYTRWARPYLIATQKLLPAEYHELQEKHKELGLGPEAIPTPFHALWIYLELFGDKSVKLEVTKMPGYVRQEIKLDNEDERPLHAIEVRLAFRATPIGIVGARQERGYGFTGRTVLMFVSYVLKKKHLKMLEDWKDDEVLNYIDVMTTETLEAMHEDLHKYLEEEPEIEEKPPIKEIPFMKWVKETFGTIQKFNEQAKELYKKIPKFKLTEKDAWTVARLMLIAREKAKKDCDKLFIAYRKNYGMLTPPG